MKSPSTRKRGTLLRGGKILDGLGNPPVSEGQVLIIGDRIEYVGKRTGDDLGSDIDVIDVDGCTVLPGLIDTHVHLFDEGQNSPLQPVNAFARGVERMQAALRGGITTIRDVGSPYLDVFDLRNAVRRKEALGPRILAAGAAICAVHGHGHGTLAVEAQGPIQVKRRVLDQVSHGADLIKVMATSGAGLKSEAEAATQLTGAELSAAVSTAHGAGLQILSHAHSSVGIRDSLAAGVDGIEHGVFLTDELISTMLEFNVTLAPTLSVYRRLAALDSQATGPQRARRILGSHADSVRRAINAGVRVIMGTDSGGDYHPLGDVAIELELLVECGMTPILAIHAATRAAAAGCNIEGDVGSLERGKRADILVVGGDVAQDVRAIRNVRMVFRDGSLAVDPSGQLVH